jgi:DNA repair protein RadC
VSSRLIKDIPDEERPREKLECFGANSLTDAEILALFFGTGRQGVSSIDLARELIDHFGSLKNLSRADSIELRSIKGIGPAKSAQLAAVFEFGRRLAREAFQSTPISCPEDVYELVGPEMRGLTQESVRVVMLNHRKELIRVSEIFLGTKTECFASPPEILKAAITNSSTSVILVHNHPSGDPSPSAADIQATRRLAKACETIGIELDDHVIIGSVSSSCPDGFYSFRQSGLM